MSIELDIESEGLQRVQSILSTLSKLGASIKAVELNSRRREDSESTNAEILGWLRKSGRDFTASSGRDIEAISAAAVKEIDRRLDHEFSKGAVIDRWEAKGKVNELSEFATELDGAMFMAAMKEFMSQVSDRIDNQLTNDPPLNPLSDQYRDMKIKAIGFAEPIGKYTGQLIDNLNPDGLGARNIRLRKS